MRRRGLATPLRRALGTHELGAQSRGGGAPSDTRATSLAACPGCSLAPTPFPQAMAEDEFYVRYYVGHKGKFGHEFLEFEFRPDGRLRYANNSNYKNDTMIRKEGASAPCAHSKGAFRAHPPAACGRSLRRAGRLDRAAADYRGERNHSVFRCPGSAGKGGIGGRRAALAHPCPQTPAVDGASPPRHFQPAHGAIWEPHAPPDEASAARP